MPAQIRIKKSTLLAVLIIVSSAAAAFSTPGFTTAQTPPTVQCSQVLPLVTKNLSTACNATGPGEVCYGNNTVKVQYQDSTNAAQSPFAAVGDQVPIKVLSSISTTPLNLERSEWGVALLRFRGANLAGTTAGQVVTFVL